MSKGGKGKGRGKRTTLRTSPKKRAPLGKGSSEGGQTTTSRYSISQVSSGRLVGYSAGFLLLVGLSFFIKTFFFAHTGTLTIVYPFDGSLFPPEIIAPTISWEDRGSDADNWRVSIEFESSDDPIHIDVDTTNWTPDHELWQSIKQKTLGANATVTVASSVTFAGLKRTLSSSTVSISTSPDSVGAPIYYRDVPLPFLTAVENISTIKWRLGNVGSYETPPVTLSGLPVCGNCHSFSSDGATIGMDIDVANDKGAYVLTAFDPETVFSRDKIFSWHDLYDENATVPTFGLLARVSPDGRYAVGGIKDRAVFLARSDLAYSQLFFPVQGSLAVYDRQTDDIHPLPGADEDEFVQANATWTPDGRSITFARSSAPTLRSTPRNPSVSLSIPEAAELLGGPQYIDETKEGYGKFTYDLYTMPFNGGEGGVPVPLEGASGNGMSNFFPKYSPDGKWLVFNQAESFMLLMPDSRLYIMPAEGGEPRLMNANTESMNSWHSWSPNSKWLVFSSKLFSPYTQLFITHIDENGMDTPPVLLRNFMIPGRAANIPEFVNIPPDAERVIHERFIDDFNYLRRGRRLEEFGKVEDARDQYLESLRLNPENTEARIALGLSYAGRGQFEEAEAELRRILELDPEHARAHYCLGGVFAEQERFTEAVEEYRRSLEFTHNDTDLEASVRLNLGRSHFALEDYEAAIREFRAVLAADPGNFDALVHLGNIALRRGDVETAIREFERALEVDPSMDSLRERIDELKRMRDQ